jgi:hypothetical protein
MIVMMCSCSKQKARISGQHSSAPVWLVYMTLPTVMLQVPGRCRGELLME